MCMPLPICVAFDDSYSILGIGMDSFFFFEGHCIPEPTALYFLVALSVSIGFIHIFVVFLNMEIALYIAKNKTRYN